MSFKMKVSIVVAFVFATVFAFLPYGEEHRKLIEARKLSGQIRDWLVLGKPEKFGFSNTERRCFLMATNFSFAGRGYIGVMAWEASSLPGSGRLVGTAEREIFWCDAGGCSRIRLSEDQSIK